MAMFNGTMPWEEAKKGLAECRVALNGGNNMTEYKNFKFVANKPVSIKFKYDKGMEKKGEHGIFYSYGATINGEEQYFAASPELNKKILELLKEKGQTLSIEKVEEVEEGKVKTRWSVIDPANPLPDFQGILEPVNQPVREKPVAVSNKGDIELYTQCLRDAVAIYKELGLSLELGVTRTASTLFINRK